MRHTPLNMVVVAVLFVVFFCALLLGTFGYRDTEVSSTPYIEQGASETGAANLVSAIYLNYRLYDTLFEILVFSVAVLGVRFYLAGRNEKEKDIVKIPESHVIRTSANILLAPILLLGIYLTLFGHISPGGGFSGGIVAGTALLLSAVALGAETVAARFHEASFEQLEWGILLVILLFVAFPVVLGRVPLTDLLPPGNLGSLTSGGSILVYNALIGSKVLIGTWVIVYSFIRHRGEI